MAKSKKPKGWKAFDALVRKLVQIPKGVHGQARGPEPLGDGLSRRGAMKGSLIETRGEAPNTGVAAPDGGRDA